MPSESLKAAHRDAPDHDKEGHDDEVVFEDCDEDDRSYDAVGEGRRAEVQHGQERDRKQTRLTSRWS